MNKGFRGAYQRSPLPAFSIPNHQIHKLVALILVFQALILLQLADFSFTSMISRFAAVDVAYDREEALGAVVTFSSWEQAGVGEAYTTRVKGIAAYQPGRFYLRELPCILAVLQQLSFSPELVIVDGYVWLDESSRPGLGAFLYDALRQKPAVVGVAKSCYFRGRNVAEVTRGRSRRPLFVTSVGVDIAEAAAGVRNMHGKHRIPTLLAEADRLSRGIRKP